MIEIQIGFMKDLRNFEFKDLFLTILSRVEEVSIQTPSIKVSYEKLALHATELNRMYSRKPGCLLTNVIDKQIKTRTQYLSCLRLIVEGKKLSNRPEERIHAKRLHFFLENSKEYLYKPTLKNQQKAVTDLLMDIKVDSQIEAAVSKLDLVDLLEDIGSLTDDIKRNKLAREKVQEAAEVNGQLLRKAAYGDLRKFISLLEGMYDIAPDAEKEKIHYIISVINQEAIRSRRLLRSEITKRKNKREAKAAVMSLIEARQDSGQDVESIDSEE